MTPPTPTTRAQPPITTWSLGGGSGHDRSQLIERINARAKRLGTAKLDPPANPLIATGHQAQLWHPGILAKDIALGIAADNLRAQRLHVVVDQDINDAWRLDVPYAQGDALKVRNATLAAQLPGVPTGFQPTADPRHLKEQLASLGSPLTGALSEAMHDLPDCRTLAEQVAVVLARLKQPYAGDVPIMMTSDLAGLDVYESIVSRMFNDARRCALAYNNAVAAHPGAGMTPLAVGRELVEMPLWAVAWDRPRRRAFVDLADTDPMFVYEDGQAIDRSTATLLPRALLLTAVMRSAVCDLFIHGTGGLEYDQITEAWWHNWANEQLAPMAGVTADVFLDFDAPVADRAELHRAVWRRHHLPHNLDRELNLDGPAVQRKRDLIAHMDDDRDRIRRRQAFKELHRINDELAQQNADLLAQADREVHRARLGIANSRTARRRDWCFALYPPHSLHALRRGLSGGAGVGL